MKAHLLSLALLLPAFVIAQDACPNLNFEDNNFNGWNGTFGCNPFNINDYEMYYGPDDCSYPLQTGNYVPPTGQSLDEPNANTPNNLDGQQSIVTSDWNGGVDPYVPNLSLTPPLGGNSVARIGDYYNGARAGDLNYTLTVDTNNALLTAYYAIVLEAPGGDHANHQNPYFRIRLIDPDGNSVECVEYIQDGVVGADGFETYECGGRCVSSADGNQTDRDHLIWRDWTAISVNLLPYFGEEVTIEFVAGDCALVGHLGYAYIDVHCRRNEIVVDTAYTCKGVNAFFSAPEGMEEYEWHYGDTLGPIVGTNQTLSAADTGWYYCTMTPFSTAINSCPYTLGTYVANAPSLPEAGFTLAPDTVCFGEPISVTDTSITANNSPIASWSWDFGDNQGSSGAQNTSYTYSDSGTFTVQLVIETIDGCLDTAEQQVVVLPLLNPELTAPLIVCSQDSLTNIPATPLGGIFSGIGIVDSIAGTFDPVLAQSLGNAPFTIRYEVGICDEFVELAIDITPQQNAEVDPAGPFCNDDPIFALNTSEAGGQWSGSGIDANGNFDPSTAGLGENTIRYFLGGDCPDSSETTIVVNPRLDAGITPVDILCASADPIQLEIVSPGGVWFGTGIDENGVFDPSIAGAGTHTISYSLDGPCPAEESIEIEVQEDAIADVSAAGPFCNDDAPFQLESVQNGGIWSGSGVDANGIFDPANANIGDNVIKYLIEGLCPDSSETTIVVNPRLDAGITPVDILCASADPIQLEIVSPGGVWSGTGVDQNGIFDPSLAGAGTHTISYSLDGSCPAEESIEIEVQEDAIADVSAAGPFCNDDAPFQLESVQDGGIWSGSGVDANGIFNPANAIIGDNVIKYLIEGLCPDSSETIIVVNPRLDASIIPVDPVCNDDVPFQIETAQAGGVWSGTGVDQNGIFDPSLAGAGTHTISYSLDGPCPAEVSISIEVIERANPEFQAAGPFCESDNPVQLQALQNGGQWQGEGVNNAGIFSPKLVGPGTYAISYTIDGLCGASYTDSIVVLAKPDASIAPINPLCHNSDVLQLQTSSAGGTWSGDVDENGNIDPSLLGPGTYQATYQFDGVCAVSDQIIFNVLDPIDITATSEDASCKNLCDGSIELNVTGGFTNAPYNYNWSNDNAGTNNTPISNNLCDSIYKIIVSDLYACTDSIFVEIEEPDSLLYTLRVDSASCFQVNGTAEVVDVRGGTAPYFYAWSNGVETAINPNISAGDYEVEVTDSRECLNIDTAFVGNINGPTFNMDVDSVLCFGEANGAAEILNLRGGVEPYTIRWNTGANFNKTRHEDLPIGTYSVSVTGSTGCAEQKFFTVGEPRKGAVISPITPRCFDSAPIKIQVSQPGGTFSGPGVNAQGFFTPLIAGVGIHNIVYSQGAPCPDSDTIQVEVLERAVADFENLGPFCSSVDTVQFTPVQAGGTWAGQGVDSQGRFFPSKVGPGQYFIQYTIDGLCGDQVSSTITVLEQPDASISGPNDICPGDDPVQLQAAQAGGIWSGDGVDASGLFYPATVASNDTARIVYTIAGLCADTGRLSLFVKRQLSPGFDPVNPVCIDAENIQLNAIDSGGVWSGNGIIDTQKGLFDPSAAGPGIHEITYNIPGGCGGTFTEEIEVVDRPEAKILAQDPLCFNSEDVQLNVTENGGEWFGAVDANGVFSAQGKEAGNYNAYYRFQGLCPSVDTAVIVVTEAISIEPIVKDVSCNGNCDGSAVILATGGTSDNGYNYQWSNNDELNFNKNAMLGLCASEFSVVVSDVYGCLDSVDISIDEPEELKYDLVSDSSSCGQNNGYAEVTNIRGGTAPYSIAWSNGQNGTRIENLNADAYSTTVKDSKTCEKTSSIKIDERGKIDYDVNTTAVLCYGSANGEAEVVSIRGGKAPYSITWSNNQFKDETTNNRFGAGSHLVSIKDATGCEVSSAFDIGEPTPLQLDASGDSTYCFGTEATVMAQASGGTPNYRYVWNGNVQSENEYVVTSPSTNRVYALDANDCPSDTLSMAIQFFKDVEIDATASDTVVCPGETVNLQVHVKGGNGNQGVTWDDGSTDNPRSYVANGSYGDTIIVRAVVNDVCLGEIPQEIAISFYAAPVPNFTALPTEGCEPLVVNFINQSENVATSVWDLGDGTTNNESGDFSHVYQTGVYDVLLSVVSPDGCTAELLKTKHIQTYKAPIADFTYNPNPISVKDDFIQFYDASVGNISQWEWRFEDNDANTIESSQEVDPTVESPQNAGEYVAHLTVTTVDGCVDSISKTFEIEPEFGIFVPNAYTPNADGINESFIPVAYGISEDNYEFRIYDRWGEMIWSTNDPKQGWDGSMNKNPHTIVKTDVYVWQVSVRDYSGLPHEFVGHVTLLK